MDIDPEDLVKENGSFIYIKGEGGKGCGGEVSSLCCCVRHWLGWKVPGGSSVPC